MYIREVGDIPAGSVVHHADHNKDNNDPTNLECITASLHMMGHMQCPNRKKTSADFLKANNTKLQQLVIAAKRGEYIGKDKARKLLKGNKIKECSHCGTEFHLKDTSRNDTKYCSTACAQRGSKKARFPDYVPLAEKLNCTVCTAEFTPVTGNQTCCTELCRKKATELRRKLNVVFRECIKCGDSYETVKSSKKKYCTVDCRKSGKPNSCSGDHT